MSNHTDRSAALHAISTILHDQFGAIAMLNEACDRDLVKANMFLMDAIDLVDVAASAVREKVSA